MRIYGTTKTGAFQHPSFAAAAAAAAGTPVYGHPDVSRHSLIKINARITIFGHVRENVAGNNTAFE